jgi:hypothetical protein
MVLNQLQDRCISYHISANLSEVAVEDLKGRANAIGKAACIGDDLDQRRRASRHRRVRVPQGEWLITVQKES